MDMQRSGLERVWQTLIFEAMGLLLAVPLYEAAFGRTSAEAISLMVVLAVVVLIWSPLHNAAFDHIEYRMTGRRASDRPHGLRLLHAISHEVTPIVVTLPLILWIGQHSLSDALAVNLGLTLFYVAYAYVFYLIYDRLCPLPVPIIT
jgi:uncharacterized membrane protein